MTNPTLSPLPKSGEPIMSELCDALDDWDDIGEKRQWEVGWMAPLVEAARRWVAVQEAITEEGSHPSYHQSVMTRHQKEWPTLWAALGITTKDN